MPESTTEIHILDTSVILHSHQALKSFSNIVLPLTVLEELDKHKRNPGEIGALAREAIRFLDSLRETGSLNQGVVTLHGNNIRIEINHRSMPQESNLGIPLEIPDNRILTVAYNLQAAHPEQKIFIVSKDINMRVKADALGIAVKDFENEGPNFNDLRPGWKILAMPAQEIEGLLQKNSIPTKVKLFEPLHPNEFVLFDYGSARLPARHLSNGEFVVLNEASSKAFGITHRNLEQRMALELLLDPQIPCVTLVGQAGTGKTLLALAVGLQLLRNDLSEKMIVARSIVPMGQDIGFLPGTKEEKLISWMGSTFDNLHFIAGKNHDPRTGSVQGIVDEWLSSKIELEALTHVRGRSISNAFFFIDEVQNLTPQEVKTIISRAGEGTKIVLAGDPTQIDNPYVDARSNGLVHAVERLAPSPLAGHIKFSKTVRSKLSSAAAELL